MSTTPRAVPEDFAAHATESVRALCERYGATTRTVERWRREADVYIPRGGKVGNRNAVKKQAGRDSQRQINICLRCERARCTGMCERFRG